MNGAVALNGQQSVLQVVILRDGLLVGTEVFVPGTYALGSSPGADLRLEDPSVGAAHATLYFQNGRAAIQDAGSRSGLFVNGHRVTACEIRSVDEILCGPFVLKTRVLAQKPPEAGKAHRPPPEVAALLGNTQPLAARSAPPTADLLNDEDEHEATVRAFLPDLLKATLPPPVNGHKAAAPPPPIHHGAPAPTRVPEHTMPSARRRSPPNVTSGAFIGDPSVSLSEELFSDLTRRGPAPLPPSPAPVQVHSHAKHGNAADMGPVNRPTHAPQLGPGRGKAQLYCELYWGGIRRDARRFSPNKKKPVIAAPDELAPLPLWGFRLAEEPFTFAETLKGAYRVYVPPGTDVEKADAEGRFTPLPQAALEVEGNRRFVTLRNGTAARLTQGQMSLVTYVATLPKRVWVNPFKGLPWLALLMFCLWSGGFAAFLYYKPQLPDSPDFQKSNLPPVALRLLAPPEKKKEEVKKPEDLAEKAKKPEKKVEKPEKKVVTRSKPVPVPKEEKVAPPPESRALKALAKLSAAGPATKDMLAAVDKLGSGPGSKNVKNSNYKLSGLIGKAPIANAGLGSFGLGGGGKGGGATLGAELLRGKGGGGIGALGVGGVGRGSVGGTVARASARTVSAQGSIDREAVARVVNSHLNEVHACYERALLREPGLAGKVVLEWTVATNGKVAAAKTKTSTLRNNSVEACILGRLKTWTFPPAKGGLVIITYPFLFNSVGY